jgi:DNA polymerase III subunit beta
MKLVCSREELSKGLQTVLRSVGARAGIPALSGVLIELTDTDLTLTTTDLELTTRAKLGLTGEAGKVLLPARLLAEIVKSLPSEDVELVTENGTVRVAGGRAKFEIRSLPPEEFPRVETAPQTRTISVKGELLSKALSQVALAASRDETRPVLTGVLFEGEGNELRIVATDSYRLAVRSIEVDGVQDVRVLVPARAVVEVARLAAGEDEVKIDIASAQIGFHLGEVLLQSRLIEGEFPAYRQLLPESQPHQLRIAKSEFIDAVKRVGVLAQDATHVLLELSETSVGLRCHAQGLGEGGQEIDGNYTGEEMRVAFNPQYLEAGAAATESDEIVMDLTDQQRPALIHAPEDSAYRYLIMPIRVS